MSRSIIRRSTRFARRVREISQELGIPSDYGARHQLRLQPEAANLDSIGPDIYGRDQRMLRRAARAWRRMQASAAAESVELQAVSAFRTVDYQAGLIRRKLEKRQRLEKILEVSAAPGYSEHHSGRAIDITTPGSEVLEEPFETTAAFEWLSVHAGEFGFVLSYPRGNRHGVAYEPWHWFWKP
jgi:D-alanyl-D-alanine carboxypeptidase